jgi:hypothetical protein
LIYTNESQENLIILFTNYKIDYNYVEIND